MLPRRLHPLALAIPALALVLSPAQATSLQSVAKRLAKGLDRQNVKRIAVLSFPYHNGQLSSGSSIVSERLTTLLVERGGVQVVERALLEKAMGEIQLGLSGGLDPATTQKLGKILGVSAVVTGTLIDLENKETEVNARLIQTETGAILSASSARIRRTWTDLPRPVETARKEPERPISYSSPMIPVSGPRRRPAPPPMVSAGSAAGDDSADEVLTLTNDDLIPLRHGGRTDAQGILDQFLSESAPPSDDSVRMARRIYHRNPDPRVRGRALMAMGHLLERSGRPGQAAHAYEQVLREFPDAPPLQQDAQRRLQRVKP